MSGAYGNWQVAYPPYRRYSTVATTLLTAAASLYPGPYLFAGRALKRNAMVRFVLPGNGPYRNSQCGPRVYLPYQTQVPSVSTPVLVEVLPTLNIGVAAEEVQPLGHVAYDDGFIDVSLSSVSGSLPPSRGYRGPTGSLYVLRGRSYRRLASARSVFWRHRTRRATLPGVAGFRFRDPGLAVGHRYQFMVCARTPFVPGLGPPFRHRACGQRTLAGTGPVGSEYTTDCRKTIIYQYVVPAIRRFPLQEWYCSRQAQTRIP